MALHIVGTKQFKSPFKVLLKLHHKAWKVSDDKIYVEY